VSPVISLDAFFYDDKPGLPKWLGRTDWEAVASYDVDRAVITVMELARNLSVEVPLYDHALDATTGTTRIGPTEGFVAEGVYAPLVFERLRIEGIDARLLLLTVPNRTAFCARLARDIGQRDMNPLWAVLRSARLACRHRRYIKAALQLGAEPVDRQSAPRLISAIAASYANPSGASNS